MKNNKLVIEIPDDLTEQDEAILIAKKVTKAMLKIASKETKRIGNRSNRDTISVDSFKFDSSTIEIKRVAPKQKPMIECYCKTLFNRKDGIAYFTNYGGLNRRKLCCSDECRDFVLKSFPDRTSVKRFKNAYLW